MNEIEKAQIIDVLKGILLMKPLYPKKLKTRA